MKTRTISANDMQILMTQCLDAAREIHLAMCLFDDDHQAQSHLNRSARPHYHHNRGRPMMRTCSICHEPYTGYGHNARPVNDGRCCDTCNWSAVVPARLEGLFGLAPEHAQELGNVLLNFMNRPRSTHGGGSGCAT